MKTLTMTAMAALLCAGTAAPALAAWNHIGTAQIGNRRTYDRVYNHENGQIERVSLRAEGNTVHCNSVRATFDNGNTREIFAGRLREGQDVNLDLPGRARKLERIDFACRTNGSGEARISVAANFNNGWQHAGWNQPWDRRDRMMRNSDWVMFGSKHFRGYRDHQTAYVGRRGRNVDMIGLKANDDARCNRVRATFDNGNTRDLDVGRDNRLEGGRMYTIDLPGNRRNIERIDLNCHAAYGRHHVKIDIYAHKGI